MVYQSPVARFTVESPIAIGQLMGLRIFPTMAALPAPPLHPSREIWTPPVAAPCPPVRPSLPASAPGLGWSWSSPATVAPPQVNMFSLVISAPLYSVPYFPYFHFFIANLLCLCCFLIVFIHYSRVQPRHLRSRRPLRGLRRCLPLQSSRLRGCRWVPSMDVADSGGILTLQDLHIVRAGEIPRRQHFLDRSRSTPGTSYA